VAAIKAAAKLLASLGHHVEEAAPEFDPQEMGQHQATLIGSNIALTLRQRAAALGREITGNDVEAFTLLVAEAARHRSGADYAAASLFIHQMGRHMANFHQRFDVYLSATLATPPIPLGRLDTMTSDVATYLKNSAEYVPNIGVYNMTGQPSMSMPLGWSEGGLPLGLMFTGRFGDEATLFRLAGQLEQAQPWANRRPEL
jgi:amidase/6-aminohexanoate-cyclic-dimer hydrolase